MRADSNQPHYAPSSVGGLMDPAFLRGARHDADGAPPAFHTAPAPIWLRLQAAVQHMVSAIRHH